MCALPDELASQRAIHLTRGVALERRQYVRVRVQRQTDLRMAKDLHDGPRIDALRMEQGRRRLAQVMKPNRRQAGVAKHFVKMARGVPWVDRGALPGRDDHGRRGEVRVRNAL